MARYAPPAPATLEETQRRLGVTDQQLDREIDPLQFSDIASHIGNTTTLEIAFGLNANERQQVNTDKYVSSHLAGTVKMFELWKKKVGGEATYRRLLEIVFGTERNAEMGEKLLTLCRDSQLVQSKPAHYKEADKPRSGGATPEYRAMVKSTAFLVQEFTENVGVLGDAFFSESIIGPGTRNKAKSDRREEEDKARDLVGALTSKVQTSADNFLKIVQVLFDQGHWTKLILEKLRTNYEDPEINPKGYKFPETVSKLQNVSADKGEESEVQESGINYYCWAPQVSDKPSSYVNQPDGAAGAQVDKSKLWSPQHDVLHVHIFRHHELINFGLNALVVIEWANIWHTKNGKIPKFQFTGEPKKADIRVSFGSTEAWSQIGTNAGDIVDPNKPTMCLRLVKGRDDYNRHIVIHEFGHALGMVHEHQRSKFWLHARKFIDIDKMKEDKDVRSRWKDYCEIPTDMAVENGSESYDPESIMHYRFKTCWLKDHRYYKTDGITADPNLAPNERNVLLGIHKRQILAEDPSEKDVEFLADCYGNRGGKRGSILNRGFKLVTDFLYQAKEISLRDEANDSKQTSGAAGQVYNQYSNSSSEGPFKPQLTTEAQVQPPWPAPPTLEEIQQNIGVRDDQLGQEINPQQFQEIARLISDTAVLEIYLTGFNLDENEKQQIRSSRDAMEMLGMWKKKLGSGATYRKLVEIVLSSQENAKMGQSILKLCKEITLRMKYQQLPKVKTD